MRLWLPHVVASVYLSGTFASRSSGGRADVDLIPSYSSTCTTGQEVLVTETLRVEQNIVNITMAVCPGFTPKPYPIHPSESLFARHQSEIRKLAKRALTTTADTSATSPSECINPSICQCGQACSVSCLNFNPSDPVPSVSDCTKLVAILRSFQNTIGPTFVQGTGFPNPIVVDFSTCRTSFGNIRTDGGLIEYCWDALADNANSVLNGCIAPHIQPAGDCNSVNGIWAMSTSGLNRNS